MASPQIAIDRVAKRVSNGGHHIPSDIIERRYYRGLKNLLNLYIPVSGTWIVVNNMDVAAKVIAEGRGELEKFIINTDIWETILTQSNDN